MSGIPCPEIAFDHRSGLGVGDDAQVRECVGIRSVAHRVIVVPVGVYQIAHGLVGPLADLRNILPGLGSEVAGIHDEDFSIADDDLGIPVGDTIGRVLVPDHVAPLDTAVMVRSLVSEVSATQMTAFTNSVSSEHNWRHRRG
jgi:hypothetical protein